MSEGTVWFDVSFTRTQQGNIGITRTVRRLFANAASNGAPARAMAYHSSGFRSVEFPSRVAAGAAPVQARERRAGERLYAWVTGRLARRLVIVALRLVPWAVLRPAWQASTNLTFDALSRDAEPVRFAPGDLLVIADVAWNYPAWQAVRAARAQGAQVLLLVYDLTPIRHPAFCFPLVPRVFSLFLREMVGLSDGVVCISQATEQDLRDWVADAGLALPPTGFFHLGSDAVAAPAATSVRPALASFLDGPQPVFVAVGSFEPKKNYEFLVRVFERLWERGEAVRLLIAGKETPDCLAFTRGLRAHPQQGKLLMTLHDASDAEVQAMYGAGRALVFPSLFEGFGLPLVEARARGCRVIASDIPAFAELADAGVSLFDQSDTEALAGVVVAHARGSLPPVPPAPAFTWQQSAQQFRRVAYTLLGRA